jgi:hypothetical protein
MRLEPAAVCVASAQQLTPKWLAAKSAQVKQLALCCLAAAI